MSTCNTFLTVSYKGGYIHSKADPIHGEVVEVQYALSPVRPCKSRHAAKMYITKKEKAAISLYREFSSRVSCTVEQFASDKGMSLTNAQLTLSKGRHALYQGYKRKNEVSSG